MKKAISLFILLFLMILNLSANEKKEDKNENFDWPKNRIGVSASTFTGYGLTYYRHFNNKFVGKICMFAYGESDRVDNNSKEFNYIIGSEFQYNIIQTKFSRLHLFAAFSKWYHEYNEIYPDYYDYHKHDFHYYKGFAIVREYVFGIGLGVEFLAWHTFSFNLETGFMEQSGVINTKSYSQSYSKVKHKSYKGFGIGCGISYAF